MYQEKGIDIENKCPTFLGNDLSTSNIPPCAEILWPNSSILPIAMKVGSKDAGPGPASFALLFVKNYAILELSDKIYTGGWWIPKCYFFTALKSDNAPTVQ